MNELALCGVAIVALVCMAAIGLMLNRESASIAGVNARFAAMDAQADQNYDTCELCNGTAVYQCPVCYAPIQMHSHENDFTCETHGFVNPIRMSDGARINGDGGCHPLDAHGG